MQYSDHEKKIYSFPGGATKYDPLQLDRALVVLSDGKINDLLTLWYAGRDGLGDVSKESVAQNLVLSAKAEESLVPIARKAFALPDFPDCLDGTALEHLDHYLRWMEGKGEADGKPQ